MGAFADAVTGPGWTLPVIVTGVAYPFSVTTGAPGALYVNVVPWQATEGPHEAGAAPGPNVQVSAGGFRSRSPFTTAYAVSTSPVSASKEPGVQNPPMQGSVPLTRIWMAGTIAVTATGQAVA